MMAKTQRDGRTKFVDMNIILVHYPSVTANINGGALVLACLLVITYPLSAVSENSITNM